MNKSWMILNIIFLLALSAKSQNLAPSESAGGKTGTTAGTPASSAESANVDSESEPIPLNPEVRLEVGDNVSKVFRDMVVVQRKAKNKAKHILFNPNLGVDFSDGPASLYTMNMNFGYAPSDFWEIYINYAPGFIVQERGIVKMLGNLEVYDQNQARKSIRIEYAKPKSQVGAELLWAPAYGKDSWGPYTMFRSDTFFKVGVYQMDFPTEKKKGMRYALMGGKTYFAAKYFNVRIAAGFHHMQTFVGFTDEEKNKFNTILFIEGGLVFYF